MKRKYCPMTREQCREDCAWWDELSRSCAVLLFALRFDAITTADDEISVGVAGQLIESGEISCSHT